VADSAALLAVSPEGAHQRLALELRDELGPILPHGPAIREFVLAVDELRAAWTARDLERCERLMRKVEAREAAYLEEWER
jgi:hypothetical protein